MTNFIYLCLFVILIRYRVVNNIKFNEHYTSADIIDGDVFFEIVEPQELEYTYRLRPAKDFGAPFNGSFYTKNVALVPVMPKNGCNPVQNLEDVEGSVAFIERGDCSFKAKSLMAERAGARAVIVSDVQHASEDFFIEMVDDETPDEVKIPAGYLMGKNGLMILKTLKKLNRSHAIVNLPINLTFTPVHHMNQPPWSMW